MFDDCITQRKVEDCHERTEKDPCEPEFDDDNVQLNVDQQLYGEQSITDDSDNITKTRDKEITKACEIIEKLNSWRTKALQNLDD